MKIIHRVVINPNEQDIVDFAAVGIELDCRYSVFEIDESDSTWPEIKELLKIKKIGTIVNTKFTQAEKDSAKRLRLIPTWHHGYPMPDDDFGYRNLTYDSHAVGYCKKCGMGKNQRSPFRMKGEPKWGKKHILQLNWVFDEYFIMTDVFESIFEPLGLRCMPVLKHKTDNELQTVVQLKIEETADSDLRLEGYPSETCPVCNRVRYLPITRGYFPTFIGSQKETHILKSREEFGSGAGADHAVIISNALYRVIVQNNLKGVDFRPLGG